MNKEFVELSKKDREYILDLLNYELEFFEKEFDGEQDRKENAMNLINGIIEKL